MKATLIKDSDISELKISSLPTKPTAPRSLGGMGYGAKEMKEAFDKLPMFIIEQFNALIGDVYSLGEDSLAGAIPTGIKDGHTLKDLFTDIKNGELASYLFTSEQSLSTHVLQIKEEIRELSARLDEVVSSLKEEKCQE